MTHLYNCTKLRKPFNLVTGNSSFNALWTDATFTRCLKTSLKHTSPKLFHNRELSCLLCVRVLSLKFR